MFDNVVLAAIAARPDCFEPGGWERKVPLPPKPLRGQNTGRDVCSMAANNQPSSLVFGPDSFLSPSRF